MRTPSNGTIGKFARIYASPRDAFTLIELLVTVSIIATLLAILLPALSHVRALGKRTTCSTRLREVAAASLMYLQSEKAFPLLNNQPFDGHWQYNYLIWDGRDFDHNFGPIVQGGYVGDMTILYCTVQTAPHHQFNTYVNPWPVQELLDTRAGFGRRPMISGMDVTQLSPSTAIYADLFHTAEFVERAHQTGVNASFSDGHVRFVDEVGDISDNPMALPTSLIDNPTMITLWRRLDRHK